MPSILIETVVTEVKHGLQTMIINLLKTGASITSPLENVDIVETGV